MSIKSTTTLTRSQAIVRYLEIWVRLSGLPPLTNKELGLALDRMRYEECRRKGEPCFENFSVIDDAHDEAT